MSRTSPVRMAVWLAALSVAALMLAVAESAPTSPEAARLDSYTAADGTNYFALCVTPNVAVPAAPAHDVVVLFDTSATQIDEYRARGLAALSTLLAGLAPNDRVQLLAVDNNAIPMTPGFVAAGSAEMNAAVAKLQGRVPLGASDMDKSLSAAAAAFSGAPVNPRAAVYIGKGTSLANLLAPARFDQLVGTLADGRIAVSSLAIGPRLDMPLLGALAGRTGGKVISDVSPNPNRRAPGPADPLDPSFAGPNLGAELLRAVQGPVLWPQSVTYPPAFTEVFPKRTPPLRLDRDSVVVGCYHGRGSVRRADDGGRTQRAADVELEGDPRSLPARQRLSQPTGANGPGRRRHESAGGRLGEPGGGQHGGGHLRAQRDGAGAAGVGRGQSRCGGEIGRRRGAGGAHGSRGQGPLKKVNAARQAKGGGAVAPANIELVARGTPWAAAACRRFRRPVPISPTARAPSPKASNIRIGCSPR
jgi:hypothetical protein